MELAGPGQLLVHIVGAAMFALVDAFEFVPPFQRNHRNWHRRAGRLVVGAGLAVDGLRSGSRRSAAATSLPTGPG